MHSEGLLHIAQDGMLQSQHACVYKRLPKRKCEMNNQNEQCYQLAISSRTDAIGTVLLFTFREMIINMMSVIILFMEDRSQVK